jgi:hypothetical protein
MKQYFEFPSKQCYQYFVILTYKLSTIKWLMPSEMMRQLVGWKNNWQCHLYRNTIWTRKVSETEKANCHCKLILGCKERAELHCADAVVPAVQLCQSTKWVSTEHFEAQFTARTTKATVRFSHCWVRVKSFLKGTYEHSHILWLSSVINLLCRLPFWKGRLIKLSTVYMFFTINI